MVLERTNLMLRFGSHVVGEIVGAFYSDDTGYGVFLPTFCEADDPTPLRLRQYVAFSEDWHSRLRAEQPHTASEWDAFRDVYESDCWNTVGPDGAVVTIGGPVFIEGEVTWRPAEHRVALELAGS